ncbi:hypothetical protein D3C78_1434460 [compost metagenome]
MNEQEAETAGGEARQKQEEYSPQPDAKLAGDEEKCEGRRGQLPDGINNDDFPDAIGRNQQDQQDRRNRLDASGNQHLVRFAAR